MKLKTQVELKDCPFEINYQSKILSIGSCFSQEMAQKLDDLKFFVIQNPCGITFNPLSMLSCIKRCYSPHSLLRNEIINSENLFVHPDFHGKFSHPDKEMVINKIQDSTQNLRESTKGIDTVILTIGTSWVFVKKDTQKVVNNCHKIPQSQFVRTLLETKEIYEALVEMKSQIESSSEKKVNFIITLSPVRHIRDGLIQNQRSKSRALEAIHLFNDAFANVYYFPSYEILIDELRDYRFYKEDMIHPSDQAANYIYSLFEKFVLASKEYGLRQEVKTLMNSFNHKPLHPDSKEHQVFKENLIKKMKKLERDNPTIDFTKQISDLEKTV